MSHKKYSASKSDLSSMLAHCVQDIMVCGNVSIEHPEEGRAGALYMKSGNGTEWKVFVNNNGELIVRNVEDLNNTK